MMRKARGSIGLKIVSVIVLVLAASISASLFLTLRSTREGLLLSVRRNLAVNNEILNAVIRNLMLSGEAPIAVRTLESLKAVEEFQEIAIFRVDGTNAFNDYATIDFVNQFQDRVTFDRTPRAERTMLGEPAFGRVLETNTPVEVERVAERRMEYYFPILNYAQCRQCHGERPFVRGVAYYSVSTAGAYARIKASGTFMASSLSGMGVAIAVLLILLMRRIVVRPIMSIGRAVAEVGGGNLEVKIELRSRDELGELGAEINGMIEGLKVRNRLMIENETIEARNQENRKYLDNIAQGLLLLGRDLRIREQYSASLVRLFGREDPAGMGFLEFVYPDPELQAERDELAGFLAILFDNRSAEMEMIMSVNPLRDRRLRVPDGKGGRREIVVDALFARIPEEGGVGSLMVIFEDRTEIAEAREELAAQRERREAELEEISAILKAGPEAFAGFVADAQRVLAQVRARLGAEPGRMGAAKGPSEAAALETLLRELHSLKGAARYLELKGLARLAHELESRMVEFGKGLPVPDIAALLDRLGQEVENVGSISERFRAFAPGAAGSGASGKAREASQGLEGRGEEPGEAAFLEGLGAMARSLAAELDKKLRFELKNEAGRIPRLALLKNPLIHLIRNAVDHGIEPELERVSQGKEGEGLVRLTMSSSPEEMKVEIEDDGRGIDFQAVKRKAIELGLLDPAEAATEEKLLRFIFMPSFSSREEVSALSGRGFGLDLLREALRELGGRVSVRTAKGRGTRFTIRYPLKEGA